MLNQDEIGSGKPCRRRPSLIQQMLGKGALLPGPAPPFGEGRHQGVDSRGYSILRNHPDLKDDEQLKTQLVVSTRSSHIADACEFRDLRYFRRLPPDGTNAVPISTVVNLSEVFGDADETARLTKRILQARHCDLFFADATIFVEGTAERLLIPHFIRKHFQPLSYCYISILEIGGSHAHLLQPLIEHLGLTTLIITDLDSVEPTAHPPRVAPARGRGHLTGNATLKKWHPKKQTIDDLFAVTSQAKVLTTGTPLFAVRVAYQIPLEVDLGPNGKGEVLILKEPTKHPITLNGSVNGDMSAICVSAPTTSRC